jgi:hypothetical protein
MTYPLVVSSPTIKTAEPSCVTYSITPTLHSHLSRINTPITAMKLTTTLLFSIATLSAANPLPPNPATNSSLVARAPIVSVKCGAVGNAAEVTYSVGNVDQAYTTGSALLLPPVHKAKGTNGIHPMLSCLLRHDSLTEWAQRQILPRSIRQQGKHPATG